MDARPKRLMTTDRRACPARLTNKPKVFVGSLMKHTYLVLVLGLVVTMAMACSVSDDASLTFHNNSNRDTYDVWVDGGFVTTIRPGDESDGHTVYPGTHRTEYRLTRTTVVVCTFTSNLSKGDKRRLNGCS